MMKSRPLRRHRIRTRTSSASRLARRRTEMAEAAAIPAGAEPVIARPVNRTLITASVMAASIMQAIDTTIANIALPHMQGTLSGTQDQMVWVLTSYIVATAVMTPLAGCLAVRLGRKRVFLASVIVFTIASVLCG